MPFITSIRKNHLQEQPNAVDLPKDLWIIEGGDSVVTAGGYRIHTFLRGQSELKVLLNPKYQQYADKIALTS